MTDFSRVQVEERPYLYVERSCSMDPGDISCAMGEAFGAVYAHMMGAGVTPAGPALSVYYSYDPEKMAFRAGFTVAQADLDKTGGEVKGDVTPAGHALHFTHIGAYATLRDDYELMMQQLEEHGMALGAPSWELYLNDPSETPEHELRTEIYSMLT